MDKSEKNEVEVTKTQSQERVQLVACVDISIQQQEKTGGELEDSSPFFTSAQWTADGTTILTTSSARTISGYMVPEDLLAPKPSPLSLTPQTTIQLSEPTNVLASAPYFNLAEPYTNQLLVSSQDHPIQLYYLFPNTTTPETTTPQISPVSSYPLTKARSETFLAATSLIWPAPGSHFIAGCTNLLAKFDVSRTGSEPLLRIKTIPSERHLSKGGGVGMRGTISSLSAQPPDENWGSLVAAGTWTRWVGLYDFAQAGECVATWGIEAAVNSTKGSDGLGVGGNGITQVAWSPCGRYLLISERKSRGILIYDVRVTGQLLGWLEGREAPTNQRIGYDVFPGQESSAGFEVWSGSIDGTVKVWEDVGSRVGSHEPSWEWQAHESTVGSTCLHQGGTVIATCSGSWEFPDVGTDLSGKSESSNWMQRTRMESCLKIWSMESQNDEGSLP